MIHLLSPLESNLSCNLRVDFEKLCHEKARQPPFSALLKSKLIWLIPIVPQRQASLHLLPSQDVSASMSQCPEMSLSVCRAGVGGGPQPNILFFSSYGDVCFYCGQRWDVCIYVCRVDVFLCMWAGVCCFRGRVDRTGRMRSVCFLPSFARLPFLCSALPSFQPTTVK